MKYLDLTLPSPAANLACDEALIDLCEHGLENEIVRFWEPTDPFVVLGYANKAREEVNLPACQARRVPVLRRCTGGGTVLQGLGCLNYTLVLAIQNSAALASITETNTFVMTAHQKALQEVLNGPVEVQGHTDLTLAQFKFSGNAQRRKRRYLLFHGTFLLDFDLSLVQELLAVPSRQPAYRKNRAHRDFLMNLRIPSQQLKEVLKKTWNVREALESVPWPAIDQLVQERYSREEWTFKF